MEESGGVRIHRREGHGDETPAVVRELARAKDRLGRELEANLRELRQVIAESERIARDLELVLQEVHAPTALAVPAELLRRLEREGRGGDDGGNVRERDGGRADGERGAADGDAAQHRGGRRAGHRDHDAEGPGDNPGARPGQVH